jgi:PleD family two-component response regulator
MPRKILLIDDDRMQHRLVQAHFRNFQGEKYELESAGTYEEGLAKLLHGTHAACLLDYQLGEKNGLQLIREAVARGCTTPIVFLTAETAQRIDIDAMNAGALDFLVKGEITPRLLERSLRYALKLSETLEALRRMATRDQLTGLLNRREFERILSEEDERVQALQALAVARDGGHRSFQGGQRHLRTLGGGRRVTGSGAARGGQGPHG